MAEALEEGRVGMGELVEKSQSLVQRTQAVFEMADGQAEIAEIERLEVTFDRMVLRSSSGPPMSPLPESPLPESPLPESPGGGTLDGIAFRCVGTPLGQLLLSAHDRLVHVAGRLKADTWQGRTRVKFHLEDAAPAMTDQSDGQE